MNKLSVFYEHVIRAAEQSGCDLETVIGHIKACGIDLLEVDGSPGFMADAKNTKALFDRCQMGVSCVCATFDLIHDSAAASAEKYRRVFETAKLFECRKVLCVPGFFDPGEDREEQMERVCRRLAEMCAVAESYGITVTIEDFDNGDSPCCTIAQVRYLLDHVKGLCCTFDTGNFSFCKETMAQAYPLLKDKIVHVHCKDRRFTAADPKDTLVVCQTDIAGDAMYTTPACAGEIELAEWIGKFRADGYAGVLTIEHFGMADQLTCIRRSAENILRIMK